VFEHIDMLSIDVRSKPYTVITTQLGSDFGVLGHLWSQNHIITSWLRLTATSDCFPHLYETYKVFEHIDMLSIDIWLLPHTVITTLLGSYVGVLDHLQSQNDVITSWLRLTSTPNYLLHPYEIYTKCFSNFLC
jgi:hypothetical protein